MQPTSAKELIDKLTRSANGHALILSMQANERAIKQQSELCDDEFNKQMEQYR